MLRPPAMKVAIYARYSSDNQREASIGDQFRVCREYAKRKGWKIAQEYSDHAMSGATLLRPGFQAMMQSALRKEVEVVLAESLDRFSRDQEDTAGLFKRHLRGRLHRNDLGGRHHVPPHRPQRHDERDVSERAGGQDAARSSRTH